MDITVLVVEDEAIVRLEVERVLTEGGYKVLTAASGEDAIDIAIEKRPNLVVMDIMLSGEIDGKAAAEKIREATGIQVIYLTALAPITSTPFLLSKPFNHKELLKAIETVLGVHHQHEKG